MIFTVDPWAVLAASLIPLLLGSFWYSPALFGNHWLRLTAANITGFKDARTALTVAFLGSYAASLVMSFVVAVLVVNLFVIDAFDGITLGFLVWLGFVATTSVPEYLFGGTKRPFTLYLMTSAYHLLSLVLMGGLLALWL